MPERFGVSIGDCPPGFRVTCCALQDAVKKGQITVTPTNVVINCPIVQWGGNKENTIPAGHI